MGFGRGVGASFWIEGASLWIGKGGGGSGLHLGFGYRDRRAVDGFFAAAVRAGGKDNGAQGVLPADHPS
jgi:hypothetical protein